MSKPQTPASERLEHEPIAKLLWRSCSQTTLSVSAYGIYALTNAWFVAQGVGSDALAAVNLVAPLLLFLGAISTTLGVSGAALGTVGGQIVSAGMAFWFFFLNKNRPYTLKAPNLRLNRPVIAAILAIGAPSFLTGLGVTVLVALVNTQLAIFEVATVAAYAVCSRVQTFLLMPQNGITQGIQPIISFNRGRNRTDRVTRAMKLALAATITYGLLVAGVVAISASAIVSVFVHDHELRALSSQSLTIVSVGLVFSGIPQLISAYFQAIGRPAASYLLSVGTVLGLKIPIVLALAAHGPVGIWVALPLGEAAAAAAALALLHHAHKRKV